MLYEPYSVNIVLFQFMSGYLMTATREVANLHEVSDDLLHNPSSLLNDSKIPPQNDHDNAMFDVS